MTTTNNMNNNHHVENIVEKMMDGDENARERDSTIIPGLVSRVESSHGAYSCSWLYVDISSTLFFLLTVNINTLRMICPAPLLAVLPLSPRPTRGARPLAAQAILARFGLV